MKYIQKYKKMFLQKVLLTHRRHKSLPRVHEFSRKFQWSSAVFIVKIAVCRSRWRLAIGSLNSPTISNVSKLSCCSPEHDSTIGSNFILRRFFTRIWKLRLHFRDSMSAFNGASLVSCHGKFCTGQIYRRKHHFLQHHFLEFYEQSVTDVEYFMFYNLRRSGPLRHGSWDCNQRSAQKLMRRAGPRSGPQRRALLWKSQADTMKFPLVHFAPTKLAQSTCCSLACGLIRFT